MNQKCILIFFALLGLTFPTQSMDNKRYTIDPIASLGEMSCELIKAYKTKVGIKEIREQLKSARRDRNFIDFFDGFSHHQVRRIDRTPALEFTLYFMKNIEEAKEDKKFNHDPILNTLFFNKIQKIEDKRGYYPEIRTINNIVYSPTNQIGYNIRYYWDEQNEENNPPKSFVKCICTFEYEDKKAIKKLIKTNDNNTNK